MTDTDRLIDPERLARITVLKDGGHSPPNGDFAACVMEAASYVAGEPWSDHPKCVCSVIAAFMRSWNDHIQDDTQRTELLLPLLTKVIGTRGSNALANCRAVMAGDWLVRVQAPSWLRLAGLTEHADRLAGLPEITDLAQVPSIRGAIEAASDDTTAAARNVAGAAASYAAWATAREAAWDVGSLAAILPASLAASHAMNTAASLAAWDAAREAALHAAILATVTNARLEETVTELQASAVALVERMIALGEDE